MCHDGFVYNREKKSKDGRFQFWRCQQVGKCKARLHTSVESGEVVKMLGSHSDDANPAGVELALKLNGLKRRAVSSQETPLQLIETIFESSTQAEKLIAPSHGTLSRMINRAKKAASRAPVLPQHRRFIKIPDAYCTRAHRADQRNSC